MTVTFRSPIRIRHTRKTRIAFAKVYAALGGLALIAAYLTATSGGWPTATALLAAGAFAAYRIFVLLVPRQTTTRIAPNGRTHTTRSYR